MGWEAGRCVSRLFYSFFFFFSSVLPALFRRKKDTGKTARVSLLAWLLSALYLVFCLFVLVLGFKEINISLLFCDVIRKSL